MIWLARAVAAVLLLVFRPDPHAEILLAAFVCGAVAWNAVELRGSPLGRVTSLVLLVVVAIYNPVFPVPLPAGVWGVAGLLAGTVVGLSTLEAAPADPHLPRYQAAFWLGGCVVALGYFGLDAYRSVRLVFYAPYTSAVVEGVAERQESDDDSSWTSYVAVYRFDVQGRTYRGETTRTTRPWKSGERVAVRYDPSDPTRNCAGADGTPLFDSFIRLLVAAFVAAVVCPKHAAALRPHAPQPEGAPGDTTPAVV